MFFWGLIGVVWVKWLLPRLLALINRIPWKARYSLTAVCTVLMVIDIAFTLMALDCWYGRMAGQPQRFTGRDGFSERYSDAYMANRFQTMHIDPSRPGVCEWPASILRFAGRRCVEPKTALACGW